MNQIERITINEKRLDNVLNNIKELDNNLKTFKNNKKNIELLNKYYGSKNWFKDKEDFLERKILSEFVGKMNQIINKNLIVYGLPVSPFAHASSPGAHGEED